MKQTTLTTIVVKWIAAKRIDAGKSQTELAAAVGLKTHATWSKIVSLQSSMKVDQLYAVCQELKVVPSELMKEVELIANLLRSTGQWMIVPHIADKEKDDMFEVISVGLRPYRGMGAPFSVLVPSGIIPYLSILLEVEQSTLQAQNTNQNTTLNHL